MVLLWAWTRFWTLLFLGGNRYAWISWGLSLGHACLSFVTQELHDAVIKHARHCEESAARSTRTLRRVENFVTLDGI